MCVYIYIYTHTYISDGLRHAPPPGTSDAEGAPYPSPEAVI